MNIMASILPDDVLDKQLCSVCKKYLSCPPIKIDRNGKRSCGRCNANKTTGPNSLYEKVAKFSLFPCINRYEGCTKLLRSQDVAQHETICKGTLFSCPICFYDQSNKISLLYLIDHYRTLHQEYVLEEPTFFIDPNVMSENTYLYCDSYNNCLFLIKVVCTQDRLFLSASVPPNRKVMQRFRLNNVLQEPNRVTLCSVLEESEICLEATVAEVTGEEHEAISCKFLYDIVDKIAPVVAIDFIASEEPEISENTARILPKIYLDSQNFQEKENYKLSPCKTKLINRSDSNFSIKLKCDSCDSYFWNISEWDTIRINLDNNYVFEYGAYQRKMKDIDDLICLQCFRYLYKYNRNSKEWLCVPKATAPIFKLKFHCRFGCGTVCFVWELHKHETDCKFNLERSCDEYVKKYFGESTYNDDDLFVVGNFIRSLEFNVEFYSFQIFGLRPRLLKPEDVTSQERLIYLITDDGLQCKVYYKYEKGNFCIRVEHDYDVNRYVVIIRIEGRFVDDPVKEIMYSATSEYHAISRPILAIEKTADGVIQYVKETPCFVVILKKI